MTHEPIFRALWLSEYDPEVKHEKEYWDCTIKLGDKAAANFTRNLIRFKGELTSSCILNNGHSRLSNIEAALRIRLPKGVSLQFMEESGIQLTKPEVVSTN